MTEDYNGSKQEGFGLMEQTIHNGRRWSAANAYLRPAMKRPNVSLVRGFARRIVIENGRANGVEIERGGAIEIVKAKRDIIISASSFNSPKLLMLSGIGPAAHLQSMGIEVKADRPGVGANLQDHMEFYFQQVSTKPVSLYSWLPWFWQGVAGAQWLMTRTGLGSSNQFEACAFLRSAPGLKQPDIQYHFLPVAISYDGKAAAKSHGFQVHVGYNLSKSRGAVTLRSADPKADPVIRFNYMSHPEDWEKFRHCVRLTREIFRQPAFDTYRGPEIQPGEGVANDAEIDAFLREHLESAYHPCGTCRMGDANDPNAVVDPETRVIGVDGMRVADSSIFPHVTYGNLNGPSIMTGEKAADHILGKQPLPRSNQEPWVNPRAASSDRAL
jgi:choline dehydrogenase